MIAPNGDHPTTARVVNHPPAITIVQYIPQPHRSYTNDLLSDIIFDPDLIVIYGLLAGTVLLLLVAFLWSNLT